MATQAATYQQVVSASNDYLLATASDSGLSEIIVRAQNDPTSLSEGEMQRYFSHTRVFWRNMDNAFVQHERGVLADAEWEVYLGIARRSRMRIQPWLWEMHRQSLNPKFMTLMDSNEGASNEGAIEQPR
jgi:hypothetical protein